MGRTKRPDGSQTPRSNPTGSQAGPMDEYLQTPAAASREQAGATMADSPHHVLPPETAGPTLTDISADIRALAAQMVTKTDLQTLSDDLHAAIRLEVTALRAEMTTHNGRLQTLEGNMQETMGRTGTTTTAVTRQGNMLLALRRQTEDLDNRGRRSNIRVRGLPEPQADEDIEATLKALFQTILGEDLPADLTFDRAHRANRPRIPDGTPRDAICCLHHYKHKERIMQKARTRPLWRFRGADVALFQDLSPLTLEARRALRPVTTLLRERNIPYKWGFPFALLARHQNEWIPLRWPEESPGFLHRLELPPTEITDWVLGPLEPRPRPPTPRPQRRRRGDSPRRPTARRQLDPAEPEE
ncbi:Hypothetical predicted protein [Pelobates cultripes]|uniref:L1 transposable element RRM domain-containing protein n=1 Tax=Pelobates cultripes TaxID=61616 RepID=A0AAD1S145_PELCU|nr:Hypothetical predicted protein [Pelobates cultripes]